MKEEACVNHVVKIVRECAAVDYISVWLPAMNLVKKCYYKIILY